MPRPRTIPHPFEKWPEPDYGASSIAIAANALWRRAELQWVADPGGPDPIKRLDGALAYVLDVLEELRKSLDLPKDAHWSDVTDRVAAADITAFEVEDGQTYIAHVRTLLDRAIARELPQSDE